MDPVEQVPPALDGNRVEVLVDGEETFTPMLASVAGARRHVHLLQLLFHPGFVVLFDGGTPPRPAAPRANLAEELVRAARRGVAVRVLLNENAVATDTVRALRSVLEGDGRPIEVRGFPLGPHAMHAKMVLVDGTDAYLIGPPFEQRFWDDAGHAAMDARRGTDRPLHDVSIRVRGPAAADAEALFAALWNLRSPPGRPLLRAPPRPAPAGPHRVRLARTLPSGLLGPRAERGILEAYLSAIGQARHWIYLETQYFTSPTIVRALHVALARGVDVVLVLNEAVDIPTYETWQRRRLAELGWPGREGLVVASLWTPVSRPDGWHARPIYVHSKVGIVDDAWCTVGAANLDSFGLEEAEEFLVPLPSNVEANLVLREPEVAGPLRRRLWTEHGGPGLDGPVPPGGWAAAWRRTAVANLEALGLGRRPESRILPFDPPTPRAERTASRGP